MILYFLLYFVLLLGAYISRKSSFSLFGIILLMSLMIGFRGENVGIDTVAYQTMYESLGKNGYMGYPEPLYGMLCVWAYSLGLSFSIFQTILIFFSLCLVAYVIKKQSPNYCFSLFLLLSLYFLLYSMNIYRQMLACYIMFYALFLLYRDNIRWAKTKFVFLLLIAASIHNASLFLFPILILKRINVNNRFVVISIFFSFIIGFFDIIGSFYYTLGIYENNLSEFNRSGSKVIMACFLALYWIIAYYYMYKKSLITFRNSMYMKLFFGGIVINNLLLRQDMGLRLMLFFTLPLIIGIPIFVSSSRNILMTKAITIVYCSIYFFVFVMTNSADVVPYYFTE